MIDEATLLRYLRRTERQQKAMKGQFAEDSGLDWFHFGKETMCKLAIAHVKKTSAKSRTPATRAATRTKAKAR